MSFFPPEDKPLLQEICDLFTEAEKAIKEVEDTGGELVVPAVNQLRYTGNHLVRYLCNPEKTDELHDSVRHCKRATYDAYEAAILYQLEEYRKFKDDYRKTVVIDVIPDYPEIVTSIENARKFARENNNSKTRGEFYLAGRDHLVTITASVNKLDACRDELNKKIKKDRSNFILQLVVIGIAIIGTTIALIAWRWPVH